MTLIGMRRYLSEANLIRAALMASVMTALSVPRILYWGVPLAPYALAAFFAMVLLSGAATAWGRDGGMVGLFPERRRLFCGMAIAVALVIVILPLQLQWITPILREGLDAAGKTEAIRLRFPHSFWGKLGLMLWSVGFEMMFLQASLISFLARLLRHQWRALAVAFALLALISHAIISPLELGSITPPLIWAGAFSNLIGCWLFARFGLPATMTYAGGLCVHHFFL